jgi:hypothetical protein
MQEVHWPCQGTRKRGLRRGDLEEGGEKLALLGAQDGKVNKTGFEALKHFVSQLYGLNLLSRFPSTRVF